MKDITRKLKNNFTSGTRDFNDDGELVAVKQQLFPVEVLHAAQGDLGTDVLTDYYRQMYEFGIDAQMNDTKIKPAQLTGITLTHNKLKTWLGKKSISDIAEIENPAVMKLFLKHHINAMQEALTVFKAISKVLGDE
jgi:hypothetical protein